MRLLRKVYYMLPTKLRLWMRWLRYLPVDIAESLLGKRKGLVPPKRLIYTGSGDIRKIGEKHLDDLIRYDLIMPDSSVLDVGCGIGKLAIPLTSYLSPKGRYEGFDVVRTGVKWCVKNISAQFPNFHFQYIPIYNDLYQPSGQDAKEFQFPYPDKNFDIVLLTSVFTHMLPEEIENYMNEIQRVLIPGGYCYSTFFLLTDNVRQAMKAGDGLNFKYHFGNYSAVDKKIRQANVALEKAYLESMISSIPELQITGIVHGWWSGAYPKDVHDFQDVVILRRT